MAKIVDAILNPLIALLFGLALLLFIWGMVQFIWTADTEDGRDTGKRHMLWAIIGMFVMVAAYAILKIAANTFGITLPR